ncbi:efflux RND transporter periplasmic adaptor subunit [Belliella sp. DSM 107340]|uniref:Efflux RND transporter periplasmic adaptor subunit n=1 Tax=Belliella calami TaxID=2923436 RepID=A0ABS9UR65_9BACT|nr:efflux RND transporter periplasmic adaptor subunit [Belliella calami]MCH7399116.1 efflux RND transporter periplasmic adaptor subunit [Belliella calami]
MKQFRLFFIVAVLLVTTLSCEEEKKESQEIPSESFRGEVAATPVRVAKAEKRTFDYLINATGKIDAMDQVKIVTQRQGILSELNVKEGDFVEKGTVLAKLDDSEAKFRLEKAKIALKNSQVNYDSDILSFSSIMESEDNERKTNLVDQLKSKSGLFSAEIDLKEAELEIEKSTIKAPISGRVADLKIKKGSLVSSGEDFMEIINTNTLELKVKVLESDINLISIGQKAEVYPVSSSNIEVTGTVRSINPKVDENGLVQVSLLVSGSKGLLPGMNARAIIRAPQTNSIVIPKQALVYRSSRAVVFTIENNESKWNYVEVGKDNGKEVEILSGIEADNTVITTNNLQLAHQAPIQIVKD